MVWASGSVDTSKGATNAGTEPAGSGIPRGTASSEALALALGPAPVMSLALTLASGSADLTLVLSSRPCQLPGCRLLPRWRCDAWPRPPLEAKRLGTAAIYLSAPASRSAASAMLAAGRDGEGRTGVTRGNAATVEPAPRCCWLRRQREAPPPPRHPPLKSTRRGPAHERTVRRAR